MRNRRAVAKRVRGFAVVGRCPWRKNRARHAGEEDLLVDRRRPCGVRTAEERLKVSVECSTVVIESPEGDVHAAEDRRSLRSDLKTGCVNDGLAVDKQLQLSVLLPHGVELDALRNDRVVPGGERESATGDGDTESVIVHGVGKLTGCVGVAICERKVGVDLAGSCGATS